MNKWILGARPRTLPAAIAPVFVASALAGNEFNLFRAVLALKVGMWLQIGVNFANDYSDGIRGTDTNRIGPTRLVASGLASAKSVKAAAMISFGIACICGLWLALLTSGILILVGAISIAAAWGYTGGKNPYGYRGLGEFSVFIFFGVVATVGSYYVQTERITLSSLILAIPMGALACSILMVNNIRDRSLDQLVGKKTLAVRFGDVNARRILVTMLLISHISTIAIAFPKTLISLIAAPMSFAISKSILSGTKERELIPVLGQVGKLQLLFAATIVAALVIQ